MHVKRLLAPSKQGDDGWRSVQVDGVTLEDWRNLLLGVPSVGAAGATGGGGRRRGGGKGGAGKVRHHAGYIEWQ